MKAMKDVIYAGLVKAFGEIVSDEYPSEWKKGTEIQLTEEQNRVLESDNQGETKSLLRYRIDIYSDKSTTGDSIAVDRVLAGIGFKRIDCKDELAIPGYHHKMMRYEAIADLESEALYWQ